uniref:Uncharacterized protein n=1 Tax=Anguilla anguilla TaxID=7936 RepID=A0A0E9QJ14_ANGAN
MHCHWYHVCVCGLEKIQRRKHYITLKA